VVPTFASVSQIPSSTIAYVCSPGGSSNEATRQPSDRKAGNEVPGLA